MSSLFGTGQADLQPISFKSDRLLETDVIRPGRGRFSRAVVSRCCGDFTHGAQAGS